MQTFDLKNVSFDDSRVFSCVGNMDFYKCPWEIAEEVFCNYVIKIAFSKIFLEAKKIINSKELMFTAEKEEANRILAELSSLCERNKAVGRLGGGRKWNSQNEASLFCGAFNWKVVSLCGVLSRISTLEKDKFTIDESEVIEECFNYGRNFFSERWNEEQEKVIDGCLYITHSYFSCLERIFILEDYQEAKQKYLNLLAKCIFVFEHYFFTCGRYLEAVEAKEVTNSLQNELDGILKEYGIERNESIALDVLFEKYNIGKNHMGKDYFLHIFSNESPLENSKWDICFRKKFLGESSEKENDIFNFYLETREKYLSSLATREVVEEEIESIYFEIALSKNAPKRFYIENDCFDGNIISEQEKTFSERKGKDILAWIDESRSFYKFSMEDYEQKHFSRIEKIDLPIKYVGKASEQVKVENAAYFKEEFEDLERRAKSIENLCEEYKDKNFISQGEIKRVLSGLETLKKDIDFCFNHTRAGKKDIDKIKKALISMDSSNRNAFWEAEEATRKCGVDEKGEDSYLEEYETIDKYKDSIEKDFIEEAGCSIYGEDGEELSLEFDRRISGLKSVIDKRYLSELKIISGFLEKNKENSNLDELKKETEKCLEIARYAYAHDEHIESKFYYFEEAMKDLLLKWKSIENEV